MPCRLHAAFSRVARSLVGSRYFPRSSAHCRRLLTAARTAHGRSRVDLCAGACAHATTDAAQTVSRLTESTALSARSQVVISDVAPAIFEQVLRFMYKGEVPFFPRSLANHSAFLRIPCVAQTAMTLRPDDLGLLLVVADTYQIASLNVGIAVVLRAVSRH